MQQTLILHLALLFFSPAFLLSRSLRRSFLHLENNQVNLIVILKKHNSLYFGFVYFKQNSTSTSCVFLSVSDIVFHVTYLPTAN